MVKGFAETLTAIAGAVLIAFIFRTAAFATYYIPSESMVPTLEVGDRLAVSKFAYGYSRYSVPGIELPTAVHGRLLGGDPARGDVIVFRRPSDGETMVKRLIGLPGDTVQLRHGRLIINGQLTERELLRHYSYRDEIGLIVKVAEYRERLPEGQAHLIIERSDKHPADDTAVYQVPAGHYFLLGDNRDNSADSRFAGLGFVPAENLLGRADTILFSLSACVNEPGLDCAPRRILTMVE